MADIEVKETSPGGGDPESTVPDWAVGLLTVEAISLLIGLAMPVTPSKTGSIWSPAQLFVADPSYLIEVVVYFVMTNILILFLGLCAWVLYRVRGPD